MATCVAQESSTQLPPIRYPRKYLRTITYDSKMSSESCRKRLLSEQNDYCNSLTIYPNDIDEINKKVKTGFLGSESRAKYQHHGMQSSTAGFFESVRVCRSAPGLLRRKSLTHAPFTYIKHFSSAQMNTALPPILSKTTTTLLEKNMLVCQQTNAVVKDQEGDRDSSLIFLTCAEVAAYVSADTNNVSRKVLLIDCGSSLRHSERRIQGSLLLNVNDKISRKRLSTRGLKNFLDSTQLNRLDKSEIIILYDDFIRQGPCMSSVGSIQLSPSAKCVYDEIKRYNTNKTILALQSSFDEFYQHHPSLCYVSTSTDEDILSPSPMTAQPVDIDSFQISEIFPGLYLGNARDAEDANLLKQHQIATIVNISTSIPCYFEDPKVVDYLRLPCHDSPTQNILQYFESTFEYIHRKLSTNKNVLIHCQGGVSRSPSFVVGYLMRYHSKTLNEALALVRNKRSIINPNLNFLGQLTQYQQMLTSA